MRRKCGGKEGGEGGSGAQKRGPAPSPPDTVGANKKTSTPSTSDKSTKTKTTNLNLAQGTTVDALRIATSYFDKGWNAFAWGFLPVYETNQAENGLRYYSLACSMHSVRMWICGQISEQFQSGESLCHSWN